MIVNKKTCFFFIIILNQIEGLLNKIIEDQQVKFIEKLEHSENEELNVMYIFEGGHVSFHSQLCNKRK